MDENPRHDTAPEPTKRWLSPTAVTFGLLLLLTTLNNIRLSYSLKASQQQTRHALAQTEKATAAIHREHASTQTALEAAEMWKATAQLWEEIARRGGVLEKPVVNPL